MDLISSLHTRDVDDTMLKEVYEEGLKMSLFLELQAKLIYLRDLPHCLHFVHVKSLPVSMISGWLCVGVPIPIVTM